MLRKILIYGNPILRRKATDVEIIDKRIQKLIKNLKDTMKVEGGVGLSSNQIGELKRVITLFRQENESMMTLINPVIVDVDGEETGSEGCLSFPGLYVDIKRAKKVKAVYTNEKNEIKEIVLEGLLARAVQHEIDHLNGTLFIDRADKNDSNVQGIIKKWRQEFMLSKIAREKAAIKI